MLKSLFYLCFLFLVVFAHAQSKVTLKKFEDPNKQGVKEIVFEYEVKESGQDGGQSQKVTKVFDIEANNPFNNMGFKKTNDSNRNGVEVLSLDESSVSALLNQFGVSESSLPNDFKQSIKYGITITSVLERGNHMVLTNNFSLYNESGDEVGKGGKFGSITVLDNKGNITYALENIGSDIYHNAISENGRYLAYAYGGPTHDLSYEGKLSGFRIIDIETDLIYYHQIADYVPGISSTYDMLVVGYTTEEGLKTIVLDAITGDMFGPDDLGIIIGRFRFRQKDGSIKELKDLKKIK